MPYDKEAARERLSACTPYQAAVVLALASHRSSIAGDQPEAETFFPEYGKLLAAAKRMNQAYLLSAPAKHITDEVSTRLEEILGSEEFPVDNEGGSEGYFMDIAVGIAYVRDVWTNQDVQYALGGLRRGYAFANELRRQLPTPPTVLAEPLDAAEQARQFADIDAVLALGEPITLEQFDALAAEGDELGQALRVRLAEVIAAGI